MPKKLCVVYIQCCVWLSCFLSKNSVPWPKDFWNTTKEDIQGQIITRCVRIILIAEDEYCALYNICTNTELRLYPWIETDVGVPDVGQ